MKTKGQKHQATGGRVVREIISQEITFDLLIKWKEEAKKRPGEKAF
jgi:hypothetical protein